MSTVAYFISLGHIKKKCIPYNNNKLLGSCPGGSRVIRSGDGVARKNLFIQKYKERLGRNSVVGKFSGEKRLNNLVYRES